MYVRRMPPLWYAFSCTCKVKYEDGSVSTVPLSIATFHVWCFVKPSLDSAIITDVLLVSTEVQAEMFTNDSQVSNRHARDLHENVELRSHISPLWSGRRYVSVWRWVKYEMVPSPLHALSWKSLLHRTDMVLSNGCFLLLVKACFLRQSCIVRRQKTIRGASDFQETVLVIDTSVGPCNIIASLNILGCDRSPLGKQVEGQASRTGTGKAALDRHWLGSAVWCTIGHASCALLCPWRHVLSKVYSVEIGTSARFNLILDVWTMDPVCFHSRLHTCNLNTQYSLKLNFGGYEHHSVLWR